MMPLTPDQCQLVLSHLDVPKIVAARMHSEYRRLLVSVEEMTSAANLGLCRAAAKWDESKGNGTFQSYASRGCELAIREAMREAGTIRVPRPRRDSKHHYDAFAVQARKPFMLIEYVDVIEPSEPEPDKRLEMIQQRLPKLPESQRQVLTMFSDGLSWSQIADRLGISRQLVHHRKQAAIRRLMG